MRFGIAAPIDVSNTLNLITQGGFLDLSKFDFTVCVRTAINHGFRYIEIPMDLLYVLLDPLTEQTVEKLVNLMDREKVSYSIHLPFSFVDISLLNKHIRRASVDCIVESIKLTEPLQPECFILHPTGAFASQINNLNILKKEHKDIISNFMLRLAAQSINEIQSRTGLSSRKLALENFDFPFSSIHGILDELNLSVCLDTGHLLAGYSGEFTIEEFIEKYCRRILEVHLHDGYCRKINNQIIRMDHLPLGEGELKIDRFFNLLEEKSLNVPLVFELNPSEAILSMRNIEKFHPYMKTE